PCSRKVRTMLTFLQSCRSLFCRKPCRRSSGKTPVNAIPESLEQRQVMSVTNPWFSGSMLVIPTDNNSTSVELNSSGSSLQVRDLSGGRTWNYPSSAVSSVEFQGGNGNDRFVNNVRFLPVRAFGGAGNDYLEGYDGNDIFSGGSGNDEIRGFGGNDQMWGGDGNDLLLGGAGNDDLMGEHGNDQLNGQADIDRFWGGSGDDVLIALDNSTSEYLQSDDGFDVLWVDRNGTATDRMYANSSSDKVQSISSFSNGADKTLNGDRIADPASRIVDSSGNVSGAAVKAFTNNPLFASSGPSVNDIRQGSLGDCYFLAGLGAIAVDSPGTLRQNIVDFNDGTYGVRFGNRFYRVDNDLPVNRTSDTTPCYARLGRENSMWVAVAEKAFAHYRNNTNSYRGIEGGWSVEVNRAFGTSSPGDTAFSFYSSMTAMANSIYSRWNNYEAVTVGFSGDAKKASSNTTPLILGHMYTVTRVLRDAIGNVTQIELRNPWGVDGGSTTTGDPNDGYVLVTPSELWGLRGLGRINWGRV
ncbi:MAG: C2 family cysteine protease, partial [Planctomycetota bacterium]